MGRACCSISRLVFGCALIVLFAIDLEHHLLPNAITLPGIAVGFAFSFVTPTRLARVAHRHRRRRRCAVGDCRGLLPGPRTKKASGWAT